MLETINRGHAVDAALFLPSLEGGGAEKSTVDLANSLAREGFNIDLVLASAKGPFLDSVSPNVNLVDLDSRSVLRALPRLVSYLRKSKPRALLSALTHANVTAILATALSHYRPLLAVSERGSIREWRKFALRQQCVIALARLLYRRADLVITVAKALNSDVENLLRVPPEKVRTIYNGVFRPEIDALASEAAPHIWLEDPNIPVFLAVGRLSREKGMDVLIEAFALVRTERPCRLLVYGDGDERLVLEQQARETGCSEDIDLPGFIANPFAAMARANVFVLPSLSEGLPGALIQAMACGVPVIATNSLGGAAEVLEGGKWGILVRPGDSVSLKDAMLRCLEAPPATDTKIRARDFAEDETVSQYITELGLLDTHENVS